MELTAANHRQRMVSVWSSALGRVAPHDYGSAVAWCRDADTKREGVQPDLIPVDKCARQASCFTSAARRLRSTGESAAPHLALAESPRAAATPATSRSTDDLDAAVLRALAGAAGPVSRAFLRATLRIRNETMGDVLTRLAEAGQVLRHGDRWSLAPGTVPVPVS